MTVNNKLNILRYIMKKIYIQLRSPYLSESNIIFNDEGIDEWIMHIYPIHLISNHVYLLPEPFSQCIDLSDTMNALNISHTIINQYSNSICNNHDIYRPFIQLMIDPFYGINVSLYEIFQIIDINKQIL